MGASVIYLFIYDILFFLSQPRNVSIGNQYSRRLGKLQRIVVNCYDDCWWS